MERGDSRVVDVPDHARRQYCRCHCHEEAGDEDMQILRHGEFVLLEWRAHDVTVYEGTTINCRGPNRPRVEKKAPTKLRGP